MKMETERKRHKLRKGEANETETEIESLREGESR